MDVLGRGLTLPPVCRRRDGRGVMEGTESLEILGVERAARSAIETGAVRLIFAGKRAAQLSVPAAENLGNDADLAAEGAVRAADYPVCDAILF